MDDERSLERRTDDVVLLGLDGGDDLPHRPTAGGPDLGQDGVGDAARDVRGVRVVEVLVEYAVSWPSVSVKRRRRLRPRGSWTVAR